MPSLRFCAYTRDKTMYVIPCPIIYCDFVYPMGKNGPKSTYTVADNFCKFLFRKTSSSKLNSICLFHTWNNVSFDLSISAFQSACDLCIRMTDEYLAIALTVVVHQTATEWIIMNAKHDRKDERLDWEKGHFKESSKAISAMRRIGNSHFL